MDVSDAKKLLELEAENKQLNKLLAETILEKTALEADTAERRKPFAANGDVARDTLR